MFWRNSLPELKLTEKSLASETCIYLRQHFPKCSMYVGYLPTLGETWPHSKGNVGRYSIHEASGFSTFRCIEHRRWRALEVTTEHVIPFHVTHVFRLFCDIDPFQKRSAMYFICKTKVIWASGIVSYSWWFQANFDKKNNILKKLGMIPFWLILQLGLRAPYLHNIEVVNLFFRDRNSYYEQVRKKVLWPFFQP